MTALRSEASNGGGASFAKTHANYSHDFWTPTIWLNWVSATFGNSGWFDPCDKYWTPLQPSGLDINWVGRNGCYVNHPGARGSTLKWWAKYLAERKAKRIDRFIWCAFSIEQLRHMRPSAIQLRGWLVMPRKRLSFIWGGPDQPAETGKAERKHGEPLDQPGNWTVFWTTVEPAEPPDESIIVPTGGTLVR